MPAEIAPVGHSPFQTTPNIQTGTDAARAFEALMLQQLFSSMSKTVGDSGLFGGGFEQKMYSDMFVSSLAEQAAGSGLGLSEMIQQSLGLEDHQGAPTRAIRSSPPVGRRPSGSI